MEFTVKVYLWGEFLGVVDLQNGVGRFQYADSWIEEIQLEPSPLMMPLSHRVYEFPELVRTKSFIGLPGLIADALPEKFGNRLLGQYLADQGRSFTDLSAAERLCYLGDRGMGALTFKPDHGQIATLPDAHQIDIEALAQVAKQVMADKSSLRSQLLPDQLEQLVQIGTSAGGAKAKAVIGWNPVTNEVVAGQGKLPSGFTHWLLKFDDVDEEELATSKNIGRIEYAYHLMAREAGITMNDCQLFKAGKNAHFMTRRFDRGDNNAHFHVQSFSGMAHADRDPPGMHGYESLFLTQRKLGLKQSDITEMYRRMVFNALARNQDDHAKNHAFIMDSEGAWRLTPAYDLCFSYKPGNEFIENHQMSINGKRNDFTYSDLIKAARSADVAKPHVIIDEVYSALQKWPECAQEAELPDGQMQAIQGLFRHSAAQQDLTNGFNAKAVKKIVADKEGPESKRSKNESDDIEP